MGIFHDSHCQCGGDGCAQGHVHENGNGTGTTGLSNDEVWAPDAVAGFLTDGFWEAIGTQGRAVDLGGDPVLGVSLHGLTASGAGLARDALEVWTDVTGLNFEERFGSAQITFDDAQSGAYASHSLWLGDLYSAYVNVGLDWLGAYGTARDGYSFQTYIHEIGHALGLGHAGAYNGRADFGEDNAYANDSWQVTVMSYFSQNENPNVDASFAWVVTPMTADILAVRTLYDLAPTLRLEDTTYGEGSTAGGIYDDLLSFDGPVAFTIVDDGGYDLISFQGSGDVARIDLRPGSFNDVMGLTGNMVIYSDTVIEAARGGRRDDELLGNGAQNRLLGGAGDDVLDGRKGADQLRGGKGDDVLFGGNARDSLRGGLGDDWLDGGAGRDSLIGGAGADVFVFSTTSQRDRILDFTPGEDLLSTDQDLEGLEILARREDTVLKLGDHSVRLEDVDADMLTADFLFLA
ncbi:MAG: M10 family metallopeptidase [Pseudomonadota bacterium]